MSIATDFTDATYARITKLARNGCNQRAIARALGMGDDAWRMLRDKDPLVSEAFEKGRGGLEEELGGVLIAKARKGEVAPLIFYLKAACGWRENSPVVAEHLHLVRLELPVSLSPAEYQAAIDAEVAKPLQIPANAKRAEVARP